MPEFKRRSDNPERPIKDKFQNCMVYVQNTWPTDPPEIQRIRAEAVYSISEEMFRNIVPKVVNESISKIMTPSDN